ncbi:UNKNOWN [Stylonychia lemnae]|uniref:Uncharacterized protein n=1 Tax=Stylonychia lemnae TaxID=5949 RepID=A0A078AE57_STYLE|nr:UNKNOWN [Stylonychia lemnae]|eukprot:CDW80121.1 UNKNOWN [Stylonychia lemnae]
MILREKLKRKYIKLFTLLPNPKENYLEIERLKMGKQLFGNQAYQAKIFQFVTKELSGIEVSDPTALKSVKTFQVENEHRTALADKIIMHSNQTNSRQDSTGKNRKNLHDPIQSGYGSTAKDESSRQDYIELKAKLKEINTREKRQEVKSVEDQQQQKMSEVKVKISDYLAKQRKIHEDKLLNGSTQNESTHISRSMSKSNIFNQQSINQSALTQSERSSQIQSKQTLKRFDLLQMTPMLQEIYKANRFQSPLIQLKLRRDTNHQKYEEHTNYSQLLFQEYQLNKIQESKEDFEIQKKKDEQERLKNQVKWKIGYNLDENGNVKQSKGLAKLHKLEKLNDDSGPSTQLLRKMMMPQDQRDKKQNKDQQQSQRSHLVKQESAQNQQIKRNTSVRDILENRHNMQNQMMLKNQSQANLREKNYSMDGAIESKEDRQKRMEHQKEWKKKNYFGGFDSSEGEASLSYKSIDSVEVTEWKDIRNSSNYNRKFKLK